MMCMDMYGGTPLYTFCCFLNFSIDFEAADRRTLPLPSPKSMGMDENQSISHFTPYFCDLVLKNPG